MSWVTAINNGGRKIALRERKQTVTYGELKKRVCQIARFLREENTEFVAICMPSGILYLQVILAALKEGLALVLLHKDMRRSTFEAIVQKVDRCLFITDNCHKAYIAELAKQYPGVRVISIDDTVFPDMDDGDYTVAAQSRIIFVTSGTTGPSPKLVEIPYLNLDLKLRTIRKYISIERDDINLLLSPLCFIQAIWVSFLHLASEATIVFDSFSPANLSRQMKQYNISTFSATPSMIRGALPYINGPSPRLLMIGGDFLDSQTINKLKIVFPTVWLSNIYGCTETTAADIILPPTPIQENGNFLYSIGKPTAISQVQIIDEANLVNIPNQEGEIFIKGPCVITNYFREGQPVLNEAGYFPTGDLGYWDEAGYIFYKGRKKDLIYYNGIKISPLEIEKCLLGSGLVHEAVVFGKKHDVYGEIVSVCLVPTSDLITREKILIYLQNHLEQYKIPREIEFCEQIAKTISGKVKRYQYRECCHES